MMPGIAYKVYVPVLVEHTEEGQMLPRMVTWTDGQKFEIDRVSAVRPAHAAKAGGQGDRYTIWINGQQTYLYFERATKLTSNNIGRWFVERRVPIEVKYDE